MEQDDDADKDDGRGRRNLKPSPLFLAIVVWVLLALVAFTALGWAWGEGPLWPRLLTNWRSAGAGASPLDIVKVSLTTIGGIGGTGYLVIKYRERASAERAEKAAELARKDVEQDKAEQRLLGAVQQLGSPSPQVRIAGVYSLADVADTYRGPYKQRVVDILCGYLRSNRGQWKKPTEDTDDGDKTPARTYVSDDGAVESTVLAVLGRHLRAGREATGSGQEVVQEVEDDQLWCDCAIDLHGAIFSEHVALDHVQLKGIADFRAVIFLSTANFTASIFDEVDLRESKFEGAVSFMYATFEGEINLWDASCAQDSNFSHASFCGFTNFERATFLGDAIFEHVTFCQDVNFSDVTFAREARYGETIFRRDAEFRNVKVQRDAQFSGATFVGHASFSEVTFDEDASFYRSKFVSDAYFGRTIFTKDSRFTEAIFTQDAIFRGTIFKFSSDFSGAVFARQANFRDTTFPPLIYFRGARFNLDYRDSHQSHLFSTSLDLDVTTGLPEEARWARFGEDGTILEIIESDSPEPQEAADPADEEPPPSEPGPEIS